MMVPGRPASTMRRAVPCATRHAPSRLVPTTPAQSSSVTSRVGAGRAMPELFTEGLPADIVKGAVPITGVHDCEPVPDITVNELVRLDREAAQRLSPLRNPPRHALPVLVAVGGAEPPLWIRMSKDYAALCREQGLDCEYMELPGHDHFDVSRAVGDAASPLAQAMLRMMGL